MHWNLEDVTWPALFAVAVITVTLGLAHGCEVENAARTRQQQSRDVVIATCIQAGRSWDGERCE